MKRAVEYKMNQAGTHLLLLPSYFLANFLLLIPFCLNSDEKLKQLTLVSEVLIPDHSSYLFSFH